LINPQDHSLNMLFRMITMLSENDRMFIGKIVECLSLKAGNLQATGDARRQKIKARDIAGKYANCKTSTETMMQSKREEIELEESKFKRGMEK
jgi:hypothetical protein